MILRAYLVTGAGHGGGLRVVPLSSFAAVLGALDAHGEVAEVVHAVRVELGVHLLLELVALLALVLQRLQRLLELLLGDLLQVGELLDLLRHQVDLLLQVPDLVLGALEVHLARMIHCFKPL